MQLTQAAILTLPILTAEKFAEAVGLPIGVVEVHIPAIVTAHSRLIVNDNSRDQKVCLL